MVDSCRARDQFDRMSDGRRCHVDLTLTPVFGVPIFFDERVLGFQRLTARSRTNVAAGRYVLFARGTPGRPHHHDPGPWRRRPRRCGDGRSGRWPISRSLSGSGRRHAHDAADAEGVWASDVRRDNSDTACDLGKIRVTLSRWHRQAIRRTSQVRRSWAAASTRRSSSGRTFHDQQRVSGDLVITSEGSAWLVAARHRRRTRRPGLATDPALHLRTCPALKRRSPIGTRNCRARCAPANRLRLLRDRLSRDRPLWSAIGGCDRRARPRRPLQFRDLLAGDYLIAALTDLDGRLAARIISTPSLSHQ